MEAALDRLVGNRYFDFLNLTAASVVFADIDCIGYIDYNYIDHIESLRSMLNSALKWTLGSPLSLILTLMTSLMYLC